MQQVSDTSSHKGKVLESPSDVPQVQQESATVQTEKAAKADSVSKVPKPSFSYAFYKVQKAREDSIRNAQDSLRADSIEKMIKAYDEKLEKAFTSLPHQNEQYFEGEVTQKNSTAILVILLACILFIAILWSKYRKRVNLLIKSIFNWKMGKQIIRYEQVYSHPVNYLLLSVFIAVVSLFGIFAFFPALMEAHGLFLVFLFSVLFFALVYFLKIVSLILVGKIFEIRDATKEYIFHLLLILKCCGVLLLPVIILHFYGNISDKTFIYLGVGVLLISFVSRLYRGILIGLQLHERLLSIILYLCTLEILPALILVKFLNDLFLS